MLSYINLTLMTNPGLVIPYTIIYLVEDCKIKGQRSYIYKSYIVL